MLKSQDVVLLLKFLANSDCLKWSQAEIARNLCISVSEVNAGIKRLIAARLLLLVEPSLGKLLYVHKRRESPIQIEPLYQPILNTCEDFLISGVKYFFPVKLGEVTSGIATSYSAPVLKEYIAKGSDPIPVWPYAEGKQRGMSLEPLYSSVPKSVSLFPDPAFYDLLCLIDVLRQGRVREITFATQTLKERINP